MSSRAPSRRRAFPGRESGSREDTVRTLNPDSPARRMPPHVSCHPLSARDSPNTGNAIRLCANTGAHLHLVKPPGFSLDDRHLARAGLDYHDLARVSIHEDWTSCKGALGSARIFALSSHASQRYDHERFHAGDAFLFGRETAGLPREIMDEVLPREGCACRCIRPIAASTCRIPSRWWFTRRGDSATLPGRLTPGPHVSRREGRGQPDAGGGAKCSCGLGSRPYLLRTSQAARVLRGYSCLGSRE